MSPRFDPPHELAGCQLKLDRAYEHVQFLNRAVEQFLRLNPQEATPKIHAENSEVVVWMKVRDTPPLWWSAVMGDAIHNLRSALDHLVHQLAIANGKSPSGLSYPVLTEDPGSPEASPTARKTWKILTKRLHPDDLAGIERSQPYKGSDLGDAHVFLLLNRLSNWDKHRELHLTTSVLMGSEFSIEGNDDCTLGRTEFGHTGPFEHGTVVARANCVFVGPNPEVQVNGHLSFGVAFSDGGPPGAAGRDIRRVLVRLANAVHDMVLELGTGPRFDHENPSPSPNEKAAPEGTASGTHQT